MKKVGFLLGILLLLVACVSIPSGTLETPNSGDQTPASPLPSNTALVIPTATLIIPFDYQATETPVVTPTRLPTLSVQESRALISILELGSDDCNLPCFWGIIPGKSDWSEARNFLLSFASYEGFAVVGEEEGKEISVYTYKFPKDGGNSIQQNYYLENGRLMLFEAETELSIPFVFSNYGPPADIWVRAIPPPLTSQGVEVPVYIALYYPENQFAVVLAADNAKRAGATFSGCFVDKAIAISWSPSLDYSFDWLPVVGEPEWETYPDLIEALGMTKEEIYSTYRNANNQSVCFSTPENIWSDPIYDERP